jgi:hypothetical protein
MLGISANLCPFRVFFNSEKNQKSQGAKSGEYVMVENPLVRPEFGSFPRNRFP